MAGLSSFIHVTVEVMLRLSSTAMFSQLELLVHAKGELKHEDADQPERIATHLSCTMSRHDSSWIASTA